MEMPQAALGMTPRSSSAVLLAVCGPPESPRLLDRRWIKFVGADLPAQVFHAAAGLDLDQAAALIERWAQAALESAVRGVGQALAAAADCQVVGVGIVATVREVPALVTALSSHPLLHLAEGQMSREALAEAAGRAGLAVHYLPPKGPHDPVHVERAVGIGRDAGPPWRKEHKLAAAAALTALCASSC
jgi:hypothetical protein